MFIDVFFLLFSIKEKYNMEGVIYRFYNIMSNKSYIGQTIQEKRRENDYSWDLFNNKPIAHGVDGYYKVNRKGVKNDIDRAFNKRMK